MENLPLVSSPKIVIGLSPNPRNSIISSKPFVGLPNLLKKTGKDGRRTRPSSSFSVLSSFQVPKATKTIVQEKVSRDCFASVSSHGQETSSVGGNPQLSVPPPSSQVGSPLFWIGVGVGVSALFSWAAGRAKKYAMEQALKTFSDQMNGPNSLFGNPAFSPGSQNSPFGNPAFSPGSPFPFPPPPSSPTSDSSKASAPAASQSVTVDVPATGVEDPPSEPVKENVEPEKAPKKYAFVDVTPEETIQNNAFESYKDSFQTDSPSDSQSFQPDSENGAATTQGTGAPEGPSTSQSDPLSPVEAFEKMMEDPTMQKMIYPYLPEGMRNPTTFKWMLQNPEFRQQLQGMLNNMGDSSQLASHMAESLKNLDFSSPEIKQRFDQIGVTPEEAISKLMANPDVAMAFQNPRVLQAMFDVQQNPMNIYKYQNDREVMDAFNKMSELFS